MAKLKFLAIGTDGEFSQAGISDVLDIAGGLESDAMVLDTAGINMKTGKYIRTSFSPVDGTDVVTKEYLANFIKGYSPVKAVKRFVNFSVDGLNPAGIVTGDRVVTISSFDAYTSNTVYVRDISSWVLDRVLEAGDTVPVMEEDATFTLLSTGEWDLQYDTKQHNVMSGLQGGSVTERFHLTEAENAYLLALKARIVDPANISDANNIPLLTLEAPAGETITAGQPLYIDTNGNAKIASSIVKDSSHVIGFASNTVVSGNVSIIHTGLVAVGTVEIGKKYFLASAGSISTTPPVTGAVKQVGIGFNATQIFVQIGAMTWR